MFAVKYNGGNKSYFGCSDPDKLVRGQIYEVIAVNDRGWQTDYTLKGVVGQFNSVWFDKVNVHKAITNHQPSVGHSMVCTKVELVDGKIETTSWKTSTVMKSEEIEQDVFKVTTLNSIYMTMLNCKSKQKKKIYLLLKRSFLFLKIKIQKSELI